MKKFLLLFVFSLLTTSVIYAGNYYTSRTGEVLDSSSHKPIGRNMSSNLTCYSFYFSDRMDVYYMVKDNGGPYSRKSLLGCEDYSITNIFDPLILLNNDMVLEKLTSEELKKSNIRFVKLRSTMGELYMKNKKHDYDMDKIAYIDLSRLKTNADGSGEVKMYLKPEREDLYYGSNTKYMEEKTIKIEIKSKHQGDRMF